MDDFMFWTEEETRYLRAMLAWDPNKTDRILNIKHPARVYGKDLETAAAQFKFLVLGAKGCGKTSLLDRFGEGAFAVEPQREHVPKVSLHGRSCCHTIRVGDDTYSVDVLELPSKDLGNETYLKQAVDLTEAAILVYDITSRDSFELAESLCRSLVDKLEGTSTECEGQYRQYSLVIVGNHSDCNEEDRRVPWAEGYRLATSLPLRCSFLETSARTGENVVKVFQQLATELLQIKWLVQQRREAEAIAAVTHQDCHLVSSSSIESATPRSPKWKKSWTLPRFQRKVS